MFSPLPEVNIRTVVVGERAGGRGRSPPVPGKYVVRALNRGTPALRT